MAPQQRDPGVPDVLRGAAGDGPRAAPPGGRSCGDGGQRGVHRAGVLRALRAGLYRDRGGQPGARQGAEGPQDRREGLRAAGRAVRVRAAARLLHPGPGAEGGTGPGQVQDQDRPGPHLGDPAACQGAGIGRHQARLGCQRYYRGVRHGDDRGADRRGTPRRRAGGPHLAIGRMRAAGKLTDLSMALAGRFTEHHALLCRLHRDRITSFGAAIADLDERIAGKASRWPREADLLKTIPGFGDVVTWAWLGEIGPAPHLHFSGPGKLASWVTLCPGNNISARKRKSGRTGDAGTYIKPALIQAAWGAIRVKGRLQARYNRLVRRFGGDKNPAARKKAITAIAHTLLKIAYQVLKSGTPYHEPGANFYVRRESPAQRQAFLERQLQKLHPGCTIAISISPPEAALTPGA